MFIYEGCEMFGIKDDELELLMAGGDDPDLGNRYTNDDAHLAASLQSTALA